MRTGRIAQASPLMGRRAFVGLLGMALLAPEALLSGCASGGPSTKAQDLDTALAEDTGEAWLFTDSCGRDVALPSAVFSVAPSGAYAQILLATLAPEKMICLSSYFSETQLAYLDARLGDLPVLGRFYGKNGDMNYEEIIRLAPDIIIDIGEEKEDIAQDMDGLQKQTGLPVIYVNATLQQIPQAYRTLGRILGCEERAEELATYVEDVLSLAEENREAIQAEGRTVLYSTGPYGYEVKEQGTVHGAVLDLVGVRNVAVLEGANSTEVSPEQVMLWAPEVVLLSESSGFFAYIGDDPTWANIPAVQNGAVFEVPEGPYEWLDRPPSVQTVLGILWLGNLLYPERYDFDMVQKTCEFYELFYGYPMTEDEARTMLAHSTLL